MICVLHSVPTPQCQVIFYHCIFVPLYLLLPHTSPSLWTTNILLSVLSLFYIPHMSEIIWFLTFFYLTLLRMISSRSIHVVTSGSISSFVTVEQYSIVPHILYPIYWRTLQLFPCLGHCNNAAVYTGVYISLRINVFFFFLIYLLIMLLQLSHFPPTLHSILPTPSLHIPPL